MPYKLVAACLIVLLLYPIVESLVRLVSQRHRKPVTRPETREPDEPLDEYDLAREQQAQALRQQIEDVLQDIKDWFPERERYE